MFSLLHYYDILVYLKLILNKQSAQVFANKYV